MTENLKPWYAVATPHEDIRAGKLEEAVFAANIWAVVQGTAPEVYLDPEEFFRKTYMTVGLGTILSRVATALSGGDAGDRIISLQTTFGGGKTHTLVALWHLAKQAERLRKSPACGELQRVLGDRFPEKVRGVAVFTNASCDVTQGRVTPEGVHTRTLWGELALQLGGKKLYEKVRANDEAQRVAQGLFVEILKAAAPCLILLDELADYCVGAAAVPVGDTTLADQTISFIQQLTEAAQQVPGSVVVATLPASKYEVAQSEKGQEAFVTLERRFQRLGADVKPVADDEIYAVVRRRLFESLTPPEEPDYPRKVGEAYQAMYAGHSGEVPTETTKGTYREQIEQSYPFHPLLLDALYTRWGSHPDFQRTRGVLRLLASVVGDLWKRRDGNTQSQPLIQPCHVRWSIDAMQAALTRLWGPAYQSVAAADVVGGKSNAAIFDGERGGDYDRERIGQGLAAATLLGSFGGQGQRAGFSAKELKVACSRPGLNWNYTDGALLELEDRCFYLHSTAAGSLGKRYWFGTKPTLNKLVVQYRQQAARESFDGDIMEALREHAQKGASGAATWRVLVNPEADLPEQKSLSLLVLPPALAWGEDEASKDAVKKRVSELSARCGTKERLYRNTLLFLVASPRGLGKLRTALRERAALRGVSADYAAQLDDDQKGDLKKRLEAAEKAAAEALGPAYTVVLKVSAQDVDAVVLNDARPTFPEHLAYVWTTLVDDAEWILRRVGSVTLKKAGLVPESEGIRVKDAVDAFLRFTDKPMIASKDAVTTGLAQACVDGVVGIGRGTSAAALQARYCRQSVPIDHNGEGVWIIPPFDPTPATAGSTGGAPAGTGESTKSTPAAGVPGPTPAPAAGTSGTGAEPARHPVRRVVIRGSVPAESWADIFRCFVSPAARMQLKKLQLGVQFEIEAAADKPIDPDDPALKAMREAARQLGLDFDASE
jgi:hypothetical protein